MEIVLSEQHGQNAKCDNRREIWIGIKINAGSPLGSWEPEFPLLVRINSKCIKVAY